LTRMQLLNMISKPEPSFGKIDTPAPPQIGPLPGSNATQKRDAVAQQLNAELKQLGVDMDPETLNNIASAITKGGESGAYIALGIAFAMAKAKETHKPEDVAELFQTLSRA